MVSRYQKLNQDDIIKLINDFNPGIKKNLQNTPYQEQEDLEQEIKLKIIEKLDTVDFNEPPSFWSFIS